ncbi:pyridoxine 5'-phosphate synthase [Bernardetia sp.]|uniref:pyridoxine 5'-phosphate synthase n=1 Tax=Bernardetia sp. TaxID=1937974 RepID=UPI0025BF651E|nr:pyridoxine 5'-phosphate synthase [Bernardetia sp.]
MALAKLSVNINKFATLRNARGGNNPNLVQVAKDCERFGAEGITIHPRPDERHIRYQDAFDLAKIVQTEFNIEGNPQKGRYLEIVKEIKPTQATLVPDSDDALTSNAGWDTIKHQEYLKNTISELKNLGIRVSIFIDPVKELIEGAAKTGADRIEFYTESYAQNFKEDSKKAIQNYVECAELAHTLSLGINAGHDLDLDNLNYLAKNLPHLKEVSIGHALVCDALYLGLENTIGLYKRALKS